jgi:hypothetical protein
VTSVSADQVLALNLLVRTHRERKEAYTAALETEVVQLRANEARLSQETKMLYSETTFLKRLLTENGITITERPEVACDGKRGGNIEQQKRIALTVGQENKRKNRRKQIYVQHMPVESLRKCTVDQLQLHSWRVFLLMVTAQPARRSSLLRRYLTPQYQPTHILLRMMALQYAWVALTKRSWAWTLS